MLTTCERHIGSERWDGMTPVIDQPGNARLMKGYLGHE